MERVCLRISGAEVCSILLTLGVLRTPYRYIVDLAVKKFFFLGRMQDAGHTDQTETSE